MLEFQHRAEDASRAALREAGTARDADERAAVAQTRDHHRSSALSFVTMLAGLTVAVEPSPEWVGQAGAIFAVMGLAIGLNEGYLYLSRRFSA